MYCTYEQLAKHRNGKEQYDQERKKRKEKRKDCTLSTVVVQMIQFPEREDISADIGSEKQDQQ